MKIVGRILAIIIAGIVSVLMVQRVIRKMYQGLGKKYITLSTGEDKEDS